MSDTYTYRVGGNAVYTRHVEGNRSTTYWFPNHRHNGRISHEILPADGGGIWVNAPADADLNAWPLVHSAEYATA